MLFRNIRWRRRATRGPQKRRTDWGKCLGGRSILPMITGEIGDSASRPGFGAVFAFLSYHDLERSAYNPASHGRGRQISWPRGFVLTDWDQIFCIAIPSGRLERGSWRRT